MLNGGGLRPAIRSAAGTGEPPINKTIIESEVYTSN